MRKLKLSELNRPSIEAYKDIEKIPVVLILDNIRSAINVGSIFRTADAFVIESIYLCGITAVPPHKEINKSALGATESVPWEYFQSPIDLLHKLNEKNYHLISIEQTDKSISLERYKIEKNKKYALIFGNEVEGVSQEFIDESKNCIEIDQYGTKHSLNVSVCAGIIIHSFYHKLKEMECINQI
jgi:23S rRNA (guanosine2251-2'-O)-methyltransferase